MRWVEKRPALVRAICLAVTAIALTLGLEYLKVDTNTTERISADVAFRCNNAVFDRAIPQLDDAIVSNGHALA
jgi:serine protease inhibitor